MSEKNSPPPVLAVLSSAVPVRMDSTCRPECPPARIAARPGLSLGAAVQSSGLLDIVADAVHHAIDGKPLWVQVRGCGKLGRSADACTTARVRAWRFLLRSRAQYRGVWVELLDIILVCKYIQCVIHYLISDLIMINVFARPWT